ncbi:PAS domain-containing hybrid sensor histidine kinase/response regulator [uncultured Roseobacter sp.]|uniref:hybrid sensor histidine kinase/response regulator n=1 Tax=uncultured Roseobacter sp. TaxID=114847 RepID=UPI00261C49CA|nr:PAS domain-containing hybrid sensor histidine kinase/response regulator [uncultured Roseobacter sp.]
MNLSKLRSPRQSRWVVWLIGFGLFAFLVVTIALGRQVVEDLEQQRSASSDNVQWTLTQVEVEYLSFLNALEHFGHTEPRSGTEEGDIDLPRLRRQFDIFYSRVDTLKSARLFADLREKPEFAMPLAVVSNLLDETARQMDGDDRELERQTDDIWRRALAIRSEVRSLSVAGLDFFARQSDARRMDTARTLSRLAAFSGALLLSLTGVSIWLLFVNRKIRRSSAETAQVNARMNTVLATSLDAVIVVNIDGQIIHFNPAAESIFGYAQPDVLGKSIGDLIVPPHLRDAHDTGMERMQKKGEKHVVGKGRVQLEAMRAGGEVFPVELALQSATDDGNEIIIGFIRDISRQVADEQELISARDRALAGKKAKDEFLTVMSHEIRTPLNGILGNLSLLGDTRLSTDQKQFTRNMEISGEVLLNHVNSVLDIARFEAGKLSVLRDTVNLGELVQEIVDSQSGSAAERGNVIEWQWIGEAQPWVVADGQKLRQILLNLVGNAIKFTHQGRVSVEVEVSGRVEITDVPVTEFRIIDTGVGIAAADTETVFEDFHTMDPSIGRVAGGTGLGLGIAKRLTKALGGDIGVESEPGEGSVFWVRLPLPPSAPEKIWQPVNDTSAQSRSLDLLVVEDNEINLLVISRMLEKDGHKVTVATDGKSGVDAADAHRYDAILMDISMPVMDGLTATRHIRGGTGRSADVPIVAVSANVLADAVEKFSDAGMNAFVGKPISVAALRRALAEVTGSGAQVTSGHPGDGTLEEMRTDLGEEAFAGLLTRFADETDRLIGRLKTAAWQHGDQSSLKMECHRIAGSAALFGMPELRDVLIDAEVAVEHQAHDRLEVLAHRARGVWATSRRKLPDIS